MPWIASLARIVGSTLPFGSIAVQLSAELDSRQVQQRLRRLEDPISALHPDVRAVSELIYASMGQSVSTKVVLPNQEMQQFARPIALLEGSGLITGTHGIGQRFVGGFWVTNPQYVLYMAALYEEPDLMERFVALVDSSPPGSWLIGTQLAKEYALPVPVVRAVFQFYEQRGLGILSKEIGTANYLPQS